MAFLTLWTKRCITTSKQITAASFYTISTTFRDHPTISHYIEGSNLLGYYAVSIGDLYLMLQRRLLAPSSGWPKKNILQLLWRYSQKAPPKVQWQITNQHGIILAFMSWWAKSTIHAWSTHRLPTTQGWSLILWCQKPGYTEATERSLIDGGTTALKASPCSPLLYFPPAPNDLY